MIITPLYIMSNVPSTGGEASCSLFTCTLELSPFLVYVALTASPFPSRTASATASNGRGEPQFAGRREMVQFASEFFSTVKSLKRKPFGLAAFLVGITEKRHNIKISYCQN